MSNMYHGRRVKDAVLKKDVNGKPYLDAEYLKDLCIEKGLYEAPQLNEKLYLHFKCIQKIQALEPYKNLKALWLENNMIEEISGLDHLEHLATLHLHNNLISKIDGLQNLRSLVTLSLAHNRIKSVEGLYGLWSLRTLDLSHNLISEIEQCEQLYLLDNLTHLDIRNNQIDDYNAVIPFFERLSTTNIQNLGFTGNPAARLISFYRRSFTLAMPKLYYLDERPIFEEDRELALAWQEGGKAGEALKRLEIADRKKALQSLTKEQKQKERETRDERRQKFK
jgi:hypothetical protein